MVSSLKPTSCFSSSLSLLPITCIFVGFVIKPKAIIEEVEAEGATFRGKRLFTFVIKYIAPWFMLVVLISSIAQAAGLFTL